ncbi:MAG: PAS domain-containing protein [Pseudomonadota bacterium]
MLTQSSSELMEFLGQILVPMSVSDVLDDGSFRLAAINNAHTRASGLDPETTIGRSPSELVPPDEAAGILSRYRAASQTGTAISYDELLTLPKGKMWWRTSVSPVCSSDRAVKRLCVSSMPVDTEVRLSQITSELDSALRTMNAIQPVVTHGVRETTDSLATISEIGDALARADIALSDEERVMIELLIKLSNSAKSSLENARQHGLSRLSSVIEQALLENGSALRLLKSAGDAAKEQLTH